MSTLPSSRTRYVRRPIPSFMAGSEIVRAWEQLMAVHRASEQAFARLRAAMTSAERDSAWKEANHIAKEYMVVLQTYVKVLASTSESSPSTSDR